MQAKKIIAVVLSLCMLGGEVSCGAPFITQSITAQAATNEGDCFSFYATKGVLTLRGKVDRTAVSSFVNKYSVKSVIAEKGTVLPENCWNLFEAYINCTYIDLSNADTRNVTNMSGMFFGCRNLETLDLSGFNTCKVTNMSDMFNHCNKLTSLDLSNFDTSNVTKMNKMFYMCSGLSSLDLGSFDTSNVTQMSEMFSFCKGLSLLDLGNFDTSNVTNMSGMFSSCTNLTSINIGGFDTSNVADMNKMFAGCSNITSKSSLDLSRFNTSNVTDMSFMFAGCTGFTKFDLSSFDTSNVTNMKGMFYECSNMDSIDLSVFDTSNVTDMSSMFYGCNGLFTVDLHSFDTSKVTDMSYMFNGCYPMASLDLSNFDTSNVTNMENMFYECKNLRTLYLSGFNTSKVTSMRNMFLNCNSLKSLDLSRFDTSSVTDMYGMFNGCKELISLDLRKFNTSSVRSMCSMFRDCNKLSKLDLRTFDTSNVTDMSDMFNACYSLTSLNLSGLSSRKCSHTGNMFRDCYNLKTLDLSGFVTNSSYMSCMFYNCHSLTSLDLSSLDTSNVRDLYCMFYDCSALTKLDLSSFDTSKVTNMSEVFNKCHSLTSLNLSSFDTSSVNTKYMSKMFNECSSLKTLILGEKFKEIPEEASLHKIDGWVNIKAPDTVISGDGEYAVIKNNGKNTYKIYGTVTPTYPSNIKYKYSSEYRQLKFTWDKVEDADRYGIAVYMAGKWKVLTQSITTTSYTTPKNSISLGATYRVAVAARVDGIWDTANAIKRAVTVTIKDSDHDDFLDSEDPDVNEYNIIEIDDSLLDDTNSIVGKSPKITQGNLDEMIGHVTYGTATLEGGRVRNELIFTRTRKPSRSNGLLRVDYDGEFTLTPSKDSDFVFTISDTNETKSVEGYSVDDFNSTVRILYFNSDDNVEWVTPVKISTSFNGKEIKYLYALRKDMEYFILVDNPTHNNVGEYQIHVYEDNWVYAKYGGVRNIEENNPYLIEGSYKTVFLSDEAFYLILQQYYEMTYKKPDNRPKESVLIKAKDTCERNRGNVEWVLKGYDEFMAKIGNEDSLKERIKDYYLPSAGDVYTALGIIVTLTVTNAGVATPAGLALGVLGLVDSIENKIVAEMMDKYKIEIVNAMYDGDYNISLTSHHQVTTAPISLYDTYSVGTWENYYINKYLDNQRGDVLPFKVCEITKDGEAFSIIPRS